MHEGLVDKLTQLAVSSRAKKEYRSIPLRTLIARSGYVADFSDGQLMELAYVVSQKTSVPIHIMLPSFRENYSFIYHYQSGKVTVTQVGESKSNNR